jgi:6-phosphogluconolactonase
MPSLGTRACRIAGLALATLLVACSSAASAANVYLGVPDPDQFSAAPDGTLTPLSPPTFTDDYGSIVVSPDGRFAYASKGGADEMVGYSVGADGALTPLRSPIDAGTGGGLWGVAVSPDGRNVYATTAFSALPGHVLQYAVGADGSLSAMTPSSVV